MFDPRIHFNLRIHLGVSNPTSTTHRIRMLFFDPSGSSDRIRIEFKSNNFPKIFPRRHVEFLDMLKGHKRRSDDQQPQKSKKKANDPPQCDEQ
jgi:hypothetical protein